MSRSGHEWEEHFPYKLDEESKSLYRDSKLRRTVHFQKCKRCKLVVQSKWAPPDAWVETLEVFENARTCDQYLVYTMMKQ